MRDTAQILGLDSESRMASTARTILAKPWRPEESTAQPPAVCGHARIQRTPRGWVCAACGHETGPR